MYVFCLSCPSATFAHQHGGFVPRQWLPAKGLLSVRQKIYLRHLVVLFIFPSLFISLFIFFFQGITDLSNRRDWPLSVMRQVLEELMKETPGDLLAK